MKKILFLHPSDLSGTQTIPANFKLFIIITDEQHHMLDKFHAQTIMTRLNLPQTATTSGDHIMDALTSIPGLNAHATSHILISPHYPKQHTELIIDKIKNIWDIEISGIGEKYILIDTNTKKIYPLYQQFRDIQ